MDDELFAAWAARGVEERQALLRFEDPEIVRLVDFNMRMLWASEIQARQFGVKGPVHPFDHSQLPLLSAMQFDHGADGQTVTRVKWPQEFYEDPAILAGALRCSTGAPKRSGQKLLKPQRWAQLLQPPAKSWVDFERMMAHLTEQLILHAHERSHPQGAAAAAQGAAPAAAAAAGASAEDAEDHEEGDGAASGNEQDAGAPRGSGGGSAARALKRARQRERRRMGKALARSAAEVGAMGEAMQAAAVSAAAAAAAAVQLGGLPLSMPPRLETLEDGPMAEEVEQAETNVLAVLRAQVERGLSDQQQHQQRPQPQPLAAARAATAASPAARDAGTAAEVAAAPSRRAAAPDPAVAAVAPTSAMMNGAFAPPPSLSAAAAAAAAGGAGGGDGSGGRGASAAAARLGRGGDPAAAQAPAPAAEAASADAGGGGGGAGGGGSPPGAAAQPEEDERTINLAGFGDSAVARGVGRGRPMGLDQGLWPGMHGRGLAAGRGRALAPPPGLQGLHLQSRTQRVPGGLSRSWMPGPPIPEAEDESGGTAQGSPTAWPQWPDDVDVPGAWMPPLELPSGALLGDASVVGTPSLWSKASFAPTPVDVDWGRTPSTLASPAPESPALHAAAGAYGIGPAGAGSSTDAVGSFQPAVIPMYVTVPLAMAHSCPHCGKHFALPPGRKGAEDAPI